jgi:hypothetical protein
LQDAACFGGNFPGDFPHGTVVLVLRPRFGKRRRDRSPIRAVGNLDPGIVNMPVGHVLLRLESRMIVLGPDPGDPAIFLRLDRLPFRHGGSPLHGARGIEMQRKKELSHRRSRREGEDRGAMLRQKQRPALDGITPLQNIAGPDILQHEQKGQPIVQHRSGGLAVHHAGRRQIGMIELRVPPPRFDPMQGDMLMTGFKIQAPRGLILHGLHGIEAQRGVEIRLAKLGVNLLVKKQISDVPSRPALEIDPKRAGIHPSRNRPRSDAIFGSDQRFPVLRGRTVGGHHPFYTRRPIRISNQKCPQLRNYEIALATLRVIVYIQICMQTTYPIRLAAADKRLFKQAARSAGLSLAEFIRRAAREKAKSVKSKAACLDYPEIQVDPEAETHPKDFIRKQLAARDERHR